MFSLFFHGPPAFPSFSATPQDSPGGGQGQGAHSPRRHQDRGDRTQREAERGVRGLRQGAGRPQQPLQAQEDPHWREATQVPILSKVYCVCTLILLLIDYNQEIHTKIQYEATLQDSQI